TTPAGTAVSRKILSPQITGDDDPRPAISTFHRTFFVSLHSTGGSAVVDTPFANGPRHCGQYFSAVASLATPPAASTAARARARVVCVISLSYSGMPIRVVQGQGTFAELGTLAKGLAFTRALVVADEGLVATGYPARAVDMLSRAGISADVFHGFGANPDTRM